MDKLRDFKTVRQRREAIEKITGILLTNIGRYSLDDQVAGSRNCENMIGAAQAPLGIAGPLKVKNSEGKINNYYLPLATTEGALVASVNRGCKAITESGGALTNSKRIGATRGPVFYTGSLIKNQQLYEWLNQQHLKLAEISQATSTHLKFIKYKITTLGQYAFIRFYFDTQDAMGMNMVTIATEKLAKYIEAETGCVCISVAGNFDIDKKIAWLNFIEHRGIKVWAETVLSEKVLSTVLKTSAVKIFEVWLAKCLVGSLISGAVAGNAQAANVIAAIFLATGQDLGHVGEGSMAITTFEKRENGSLYASIYLPDLMVGTVGGGTGLATQKEALTLLGVAGGDQGKNSLRLAEIISATVLAGEISLLAAEAEGSLAKAHEKLGRGEVK